MFIVQLSKIKYSRYKNIRLCFKIKVKKKVKSVRLYSTSCILQIKLFTRTLKVLLTIFLMI